MVNSRQTIESDGECAGEHEGWSNNAIEDYMGIKDDLLTVEDLIESGSLSPLFGTGSPEGVITSNYSLKYIDVAIPTEYYNPTYGTDIGWVAL